MVATSWPASPTSSDGKGGPAGTTGPLVSGPLWPRRTGGNGQNMIGSDWSVTWFVYPREGGDPSLAGSPLRRSGMGSRLAGSHRPFSSAFLYTGRQSRHSGYDRGGENRKT